MSKQAQYEIKLENVEKETLREAVELMAEKLDLEVIGNGQGIKIPNSYYSVRITAEKGKIKVVGDSENINDYKEYNDRIKQFYSAIEVSKTFNSNINYDQDTEKIEMEIAV